jgi:AcrR family transcriptional regulator
MFAMTTKSVRSTRRPRDRKTQILAAAMDCFQRSGYQATGMEEIAAAVGITAGALYRHFRSKQELLARALLDSADQVRAVADAAGDLDSLLGSLASFALAHRAYAGVWSRETRNLPRVDRAEMERRHAGIAGTLTAQIRGLRPDLGEADGVLLGWAALATLSSPSYHHTELPGPRFERLLSGAADAACGAALPADPVAPRPEPPSGPGLRPTSRREALIATAVPLFAASGYQSVSMEDIGTAAGVSRPAVYAHFAGKADLLAAALHRESEAMWSGLAKDLARSHTPREALERVLETYARRSVEVKGTASLVLVGELAHLAEADREALHRSQVAFVAEWAALLAALRPELGETGARVVVHGALAVLNLLPRLPVLDHRANPAGTLVALAGNILGIGTAS